MIKDKKRGICFIFCLLILVAGIILAYTLSIPDPGHGGDIVLVSVDGYTMTLQEAINNNFLADNGPSATGDGTTSVSGSHDADNIFVSIDGDEKTLQQAISTTLCGSSSYSYSSNINLGHSADNVLVSASGSEMSLQSAINVGEFCCYPDCSCANSLCIDDSCPDGCWGTCPGVIEPDCGTRQCGAAPNGCGGVNACGSCSVSESCLNYHCIPNDLEGVCIYKTEWNSGGPFAVYGTSCGSRANGEWNVWARTACQVGSYSTGVVIGTSVWLYNWECRSIGTEIFEEPVNSGVWYVDMTGYSASPKQFYP